MGLALLTEALAGLLCLGLFCAVMLRQERLGHRLPALHIVAVILVVDCALFPAGGTSTGIFVLPINDRTTSVLFLLMPLILLIRWWSGTARLRVTVAGLAWLVFFLWLLAEFVAGHVHGNTSSAAVQESKVIVMLGGTALIAAGVEARDLVGPKGIPLMVRWAAPIAVVLTLTTLAGVSSNSSFGLFRGVKTGSLGADAATAFASIGLLGLTTALSGPPRHRQGLLGSGVLLVAPLFTGQRASLLGLIAGVLVVVVFATFSRRHRMIRFRPHELVAVGLTIVAVAGLIALGSATGHSYNPKSSKVASSFDSAGKADSAQSRINQWKVSTELIKKQPILGYGLGKEYDHVEQIEGAPMFVVHSDLTHDIFLDVLLRSGVVGLAMLVFALITSMVTGLRAARFHLSPRIGALGLGTTAVIVGLITRGTVESIFEKERLAVVLGLAVGLACATRRSTRSASPASFPEAAPLVVPPEWLPSEALAASASSSIVSPGFVPQQKN